MDGYELLPDPGGDWTPTEAQARRQREREDLRDRAARVAAEAPPLSQETLQRVTELLSRKTPPSELVEWRSRLFCGHVITRTSHHTRTTVHSAFTGGIKCPECGLDPATIIAAQAIHRLEPDPPPKPRSQPSEESIRRAIERHERAIEKLRAQLDRSSVRAPLPVGSAWMPPRARLKAARPESPKDLSNVVAGLCSPEVARS